MKLILDRSLNRVQVVLIYGVAVFWLLSVVVSHQRNYQDRWILDGILWPFLGFVVVFLFVVSLERDNRVVAALCASAAAVAALIPGLKYLQPYGTTTDTTYHYLMVKNLIYDGRVTGDSVYASVPGMHAWLASMGVSGGISAETLFRVQLPMIAGALPLLAYWLCKRAGLRSDLSRYIILSSVLPVFPYHLLTGTGFTRMPFIVVLGALLVREYYCETQVGKYTLTALALLGIFQITIWHSTTPILLPVTLAVASLTPVLAGLVSRDLIRWNISRHFLQAALLSLVIFLAYRVIESDLIFTDMVHTLFVFFTSGRAPDILPARFYEIPLLDKLQIAAVMHGQDFLLIGLSALGALVIWRGKLVPNRHLPFFIYWLLICSVFVLLILVAPFISFQRLAWVPLALSPFFMGPGLYWLKAKLFALGGNASWPGRLAWFSLLALLVAGSIVQFFLYQPLVPKARAISAELSEEYMLWINEVNSAYQQRMLEFAESHTVLDTRLAMDYRARRQFTRYFGYPAADRRSIDMLLDYNKPVEGSQPVLFLLHWPGPAGGLSEQVELRSTSELARLHDYIGWGLVYDNGESFILKVR